MVSNKAGLCLLITSLIIFQSIQGMQSQDLMPRFVPSLAAQNFMKIVGNTRYSALSDQGYSKLQPTLKKKVDIYRIALEHSNYPLTMSDELEREIILHPDVMEAIIAASEAGRSNARNDYITALFITAARVGNINALKFFIDKGIKINDVKYWNLTVLDLAIKNNQEEAKELLLRYGAQQTKK